MSTAVFAASVAALWVAHTVGDHWVQTDRQAQAKTRPGRPGRVACTLHVAGYLATQAAALLAVAAVAGMPLPPANTAFALVTSGVTHWIIDRRWPVEVAAEWLGKGPFYRAGSPPVGSGAYAMDQSSHAVLSVLVPALIITAGVHTQ